MSQEVLIELIHLVPTAMWVAVLLTIILLFRTTIRDQILPRLSRVSALGVEIEISVKEELDRAAQDVPAGTEADRTQTARRAARLTAILQGARVLLVNDQPAEMNAVMAIMRSLGITVDVATSTAAAIASLEQREYQAVVSDMVRGGDNTAGLGLIQQLRSRGLRQPVVLTVGHYEPERGVPPFAFGITNRVDEVLNLVFDALERVRG